MSTTRSAIAPEPAAPPARVRKDEDSIFVASQWQLMWWRFRRHRLALFSVAVIAFIYLVALLCEPIATYAPESRSREYAYAPPQRLRFVDASGFHLRPFVYGLSGERDEQSRKRIFVEDPAIRYPVRFFVHGEPYKLWGLIGSDVHLMGVTEPDATLYLMGTDRLGRDQFSRLVYGTRLSGSIGLVGVALSFVLGIVIGGVSGYYGGSVDNVTQRTIEFLRAIPTIPLWMGLSAALPPHWSPVKVYFGITVLLSLIGWTGLARVVRGRFLALRDEDFITAAKLVGASESRVILRHMVPSFASHIIASLTLSVPSMILSETALSFLGLGLRAPAISWGVLLQEAQNFRSVALAPWLLTPGIAVVVTVLAFNFMGDGLRDAADPYS
jgi:peptide/nickel transport system permease protein